MRKWLVDIRQKANLTQKAVAHKAGISTTYYFYIETGERGAKLPVSTAMCIANALNFDWKRFYDDSVKIDC